MLNIEDMYLEMGIRREVYDFGSQIEGTLKERFDAIDKVAEYNQLKVVHAMQKCKVNAGCFKYASGYGYDDPGRDTLEEVYAEYFYITESALSKTADHMRNSCTGTGTGCKSCARAMSFYLQLENLMTHSEEVIGIRPSNGSLAEYGISYRQVDLLKAVHLTMTISKKAINEKTKAYNNPAFQRISDKTKLFRLTDWRTDCICKEYQTRRYLYGR